MTKRQTVAAAACWIALLGCGDAQAQQDLIAESLEQQLVLLMDQQRAHEALSVDTKQLVAAHGARLISALEPYLEDPSERVRWQACALLWRLNAETSLGERDRRRIVDGLVHALDDPEALVWQKAAGWLLSFTEADFSESAKQALHGLLTQRRSASIRDLALIVGVANMRSKLPLLEGLLIDEREFEQGPHAGRWYGTDSWAARRVRARMGIEADITRCLELVEAEPDKIVRYGTLFGHLQYLRQPQVIPMLARYLNSDEPPLFQSHDSQLAPASSWAAAALGQMLRGFPVKKEVGNLTQEDITRCRRWMAAQQTWDLIR